MEEKKKGIFYGWPLAVALGVIYFCSSAFVLAASQIVNPMMFMSGEIQMDAAMLGMGFTIFVLFQGLPTPIIGMLIGKIGARMTMIIGGVVMLAGTLCMSFVVNDVVGYIICFSIMMSMGSMALGQVSTQTVTSSWFIANRGKAMTIVMVIGGAGSILAPQLVNWAITASGGNWQAGWYSLLVAGLIGIVLAIFVVKNTPADIGEFPDGSADQNLVVERAKASRVYKNPGSITVKEAVKNPTLWLMGMALAGAYTAFSLNTSQGVLNFTQLGFDPGLIVIAVSVQGMAALVGRLIVGSISDRFEPIRLMAIGSVFLVIDLLLGAFADSSQVWMLFAYYAMLGFFFGALNTIGPTAIANYFGAEHFPKLLSGCILITTVFSSPIPFIAGAFYDSTGSCQMGYLISAAIVFVCMVCAFCVRLPKRDASGNVIEK